ncbi:hypothetical protein DICPUDRAFT_82307 [Dictyostelium purpureum]|uniref:Uncharacterized protein n=1 Tax=Dictyostelium purpureum TaxID=5786 RepID=F0ZW54_DICPU|nr:uncharacterized protein DICPUDRAFT_82307 [Dictyostelium purpureum]EGC31820.1 hypothetical protein DICPUDRAFT_82307 [Dictyostelium purpureum]|eukprot:XP_003291654.1 hypothetical protein DICPUDRAFT_82307 [Dictyostelium purpureum]
MFATYPFNYMASNQILNDSKTKVKTHFPIEDISIKSEIVTVKSKDTMIITSVSKTKEKDFKGCTHYFDESNVKVSKCDMWINLVDVSQNNLLYHYSIDYFLDSTTEYSVVAIGYVMDENSQMILNIVKANQFGTENNYYYNNHNQSYSYFSTNISIDIKEIDSFKKIHDKHQHLYHLIAKDIRNNIHLITFNINENKIERIIDIDINLAFSTIGFSIYNDQLLLSGAFVENSNTFYFYKFNLQDIQNNQIKYSNDNLIFKRYNSIKYYIKSENHRYFLFYLNNATLVTYDMETGESEDVQLNFKMKYAPHSEMIQLYAFHQELPKTAGSTNGVSKSNKIFLIVFHPIFIIALLFLIIGIILFKRRRDKKNLVKLEAPSDV